VGGDLGPVVGFGEVVWGPVVMKIWGEGERFGSWLESCHQSWCEVTRGYILISWVYLFIFALNVKGSIPFVTVGVAFIEDGGGTHIGLL
jgi:hypothetical protein